MQPVSSVLSKAGDATMSIDESFVKQMNDNYLQNLREINMHLQNISKFLQEIAGSIYKEANK
jgi:hypothetical protein